MIIVEDEEAAVSVRKVTHTLRGGRNVTVQWKDICSRAADQLRALNHPGRTGKR